METNQSREGLNLELSLHPPSVKEDELSLHPSSSVEEDDDTPPPPPPPPEHHHPRRSRTKLNNRPIKPPYPWSTEQRAVVHNLEYLRSREIVTISGDVKCGRCKSQYMIEYDLVQKFEEIARFIERNRDTLHDRAPSCWLSPALPDCRICKEEKCVEPVIPDDDEEFVKINWLFLLLGQLLGTLKLKQLKYFCAYTNNHRTGAKNRLLYLTYLALCKQLQPSNRLFHR